MQKRYAEMSYVADWMGWEHLTYHSPPGSLPLQEEAYFVIDGNKLLHCDSCRHEQGRFDVDFGVACYVLLYDGLLIRCLFDSPHHQSQPLSFQRVITAALTRSNLRPTDDVLESLGCCLGAEVRTFWFDDEPVSYFLYRGHYLQVQLIDSELHIFLGEWKAFRFDTEKHFGTIKRYLGQRARRLKEKEYVRAD
ncbi:hypothetical protein [Bremerella sp. P1]|uniref:hypothetical protein n=1 Tax=Bremerella sp. P1 TaxID=3026424 RepID=UPI002367B99D|nr:hypothetical protein [Bremerella sp. P1]WDI43368.1 hypothetical protein PSR63_05335 [Bremerella sp. P1]